MTWKLYKTTQMELGVQAMAGRNPFCVLKKYYRNTNKIYMRARQLTGVMLYPSPLELSVDRWNETGGILLDTKPYYVMDQRIKKVEAVFFVESPIDYMSIDRYAKRVEREVIVFRPPSWREHEAQVALIKPPSFDIENAMRVVFNRVRRGLSSADEVILRSTGIEPQEGMMLVSDREIGELLATTDIARVSELRGQLMAHIRRKYHPPFLVLIPRLEPDKAEFMPLFQFIEDHPAQLHGERYIREPVLRDFNRLWKEILRVMVREGWVENQGWRYVWDVDLDAEVPLRSIDRDHRQAVTELQHLKTTVDAAPSYPVDLEGFGFRGSL